MNDHTGVQTPQDQRARRVQRLENSIGLALATIVRVRDRLQELERPGQGTEHERWQLFDLSRDLQATPESGERNQSRVEFNQTTLAKLDSYIKRDTAELECLRGKER